jgi:hypothetical protein
MPFYEEQLYYDEFLEDYVPEIRLPLPHSINTETSINPSDAQWSHCMIELLETTYYQRFVLDNDLKRYSSTWNGGGLFDVFAKEKELNDLLESYADCQEFPDVVTYRQSKITHLSLEIKGIKESYINPAHVCDSSQKFTMNARKWNKDFMYGIKRYYCHIANWGCERFFFQDPVCSRERKSFICYYSK